MFVKFWRISLYVIDDAVAKLYVMKSFSKIPTVLYSVLYSRGKWQKMYSHIELSISVIRKFSNRVEATNPRSRSNLSILAPLLDFLQYLNTLI